ncbi:MAG: hypothetical protein ACQGVC_06410 [Myxococcota bacterium]
MPHRTAVRITVLTAWAFASAWSLACGGGVSLEQCRQWDASVREVVANVEGALPADARTRSFAEEYAFVAEDLGLAAGLAECTAEGYAGAEVADAEPEAVDAAPDIAFLDDLVFGGDPKQAAAVLRDAGWTCKAAPPPEGFDGKSHTCTGTWAKGRAEVLLAFRDGRLARVSLAVRDIPKRIDDIVAKTGSDVFAARKALIEKAVADLETRFPQLMQTQDAVEQGGVRMVWKGFEGTRRAQLEFAERGPRLGFAVQDDEALAAVADAQPPAQRADSYFE